MNCRAVDTGAAGEKSGIRKSIIQSMPRSVEDRDRIEKMMLFPLSCQIRKDHVYSAHENRKTEKAEQ